MKTHQTTTTGKRKAATRDGAATEVTKTKKSKTIGDVGGERKAATREPTHGDEGDEDATRKSFTLDQLEYLKKVKRSNPEQKSTASKKLGKRVYMRNVKVHDDDKKYFGITCDDDWMIPEKNAKGDGIVQGKIVEWLVHDPSRLNWSETQLIRDGASTSNPRSFSSIAKNECRSSSRRPWKRHEPRSNKLRRPQRRHRATFDC